MRRWLAVAFLVVALNIAPAAAAGQLAGTVWTTGTTTVQATGSLTPDAGQAYLHTDHFALDCHEMAAELWNVPVQIIVLAGFGQEPVRSKSTLDAELVDSRSGEHVSLNATGEPGQIMAVALPDGVALRLSTDNSLSIKGPARASQESGQGTSPAPGPIRNVEVSPGRTGFFMDFSSIPDPGLLQETSWSVASHGFEATRGSYTQGWPTGQNLNETRSTYDTVTGTGRYVFDTWYHYFACPSGDLRVGSNGEMLLWADRVQVVLEGTVAWRDVESDLTLDGDRLEPDNHILEVGGHLNLAVTPDDDRARWEISGTANVVRIDTQDVLLLVAAGGAALSIAALAWRAIPSLFRGAFTWFLGSRTPGLFKADVMSSKARQAILRAIHESQVVTIPGLEATTGYARSTVRYHLRILQGHEILQEHPALESPKLRVYSLNGHSLNIPLEAQPGSAPAGDSSKTDAAQAASVLAAVHTHPVRQALFTAILNRPGADTRALIGAVEADIGRSVPRRTVSAHLEKLAGAGAISRKRRGRAVVHEARINPRWIRVNQYERFLATSGLYEAIKFIDLHQGATREAVLQALPLANQGRSTWRARAAMLRRLVRMGLVEEDRHGAIALAADLRPVLRDVLSGGD